MISKTFLKLQEVNLLISLAKRKHPETKTWVDFSHNRGLVCLICNIKIGYDFKSIAHHGMIHLKESNLISFI